VPADFLLQFLEHLPLNRKIELHPHLLQLLHLLVAHPLVINVLHHLLRVQLKRKAMKRLPSTRVITIQILPQRHRTKMR
jgi:hypothetical protein